MQPGKTCNRGFQILDFPLDLVVFTIYIPFWQRPEKHFGSFGFQRFALKLVAFCYGLRFLKQKIQLGVEPTNPSPKYVQTFWASVTVI